MHFKTIALVLAICTTLMELFPFSNAAVCKHCNTSNNECFVDTFGITYCNGVLVSYPEQLELTKYYVMSADQPKKHCDTRQSRQSVL